MGKLKEGSKRMRCYVQENDGGSSIVLMMVWEGHMKEDIKDETLCMITIGSERLRLVQHSTL